MAQLCTVKDHSVNRTDNLVAAMSMDLGETLLFSNRFPASFPPTLHDAFDFTRVKYFDHLVSVS